ncbi:MAG TPA: response regulator [Candidatus Omnitrophota bacterium]|nr:response regulator [Candidatus Omnitrophota bacterium]HQL41285.1 response regulator [Candidatus Omnitrophota bacterium]
MGKTVLVIDDVKEDREFVEAILDSQGYNVQVAADASSGLQKVKEQAPAVIILDILMPEISGLDFFKAVRQNESTRRIPIFVVSSRAKMADVFLSMGVDGFMPKPIAVDHFLEQVSKLVGRLPDPGSVPAPTSNTAAIKPAEKVLTEEKKATQAPSIKAEEKKTGAGKKIVIFGSDEKILQDMRQQLEKAKHIVTLVQQEAEVVSVVSDVKPDLVVLDLGAELQIPIDKLVYTIDILTPKPKKGSLDPKSLSMKKTTIILYKVDKGGIEVNTDLAGNLADVEALLDRCVHNGAEKYIGLFSSFSFMSKIKEFLA